MEGLHFNGVVKECFVRGISMRTWTDRTVVRDSLWNHPVSRLDLIQRKISSGTE